MCFLTFAHLWCSVPANTIRLRQAQHCGNYIHAFIIGQKLKEYKIYLEGGGGSTKKNCNILYGMGHWTMQHILYREKNWNMLGGLTVIEICHEGWVGFKNFLGLFNWWDSPCIFLMSIQLITFSNRLSLLNRVRLQEQSLITEIYNTWW